MSVQLLTPPRPGAAARRRRASPRSRPRPLSRAKLRGLADVPLETTGRRRTRLLRGGPRAPLPLVVVIAIAAGIGIAYVSQTARATQRTYQANTLLNEQTALKRESERLGDELDRLRSTERIVAAAQQLGMKPSGQWASLAAAPPPIDSPSEQLVGDPDGRNDPFERLTAALTGVFGPPQQGSGRR